MDTERKWKLGEDLVTSDNLLDPITFDDLILTVHCNCRVIDKASVKKELQDFVNMRMLDMKELLEKNIDAIICEAKNGREIQ